jgi:predicted GNAT family acetyltransferase
LTDPAKHKVEVRDNPDEARYEIREDGALVGFTSYRLRDNLITLVHTEVDESRAGRGLGGQLARGALDDAKRRGLAVEPLCPFISSIVRSDPANYLQLIVPGMREQVMEDRSRKPAGPAADG